MPVGIRTTIIFIDFSKVFVMIESCTRSIQLVFFKLDQCGLSRTPAFSLGSRGRMWGPNLRSWERQLQIGGTSGSRRRIIGSSRQLPSGTRRLLQSSSDTETRIRSDNAAQRCAMGSTMSQGSCGSGLGQGVIKMSLQLQRWRCGTICACRVTVTHGQSSGVGAQGS